MSYRVNIYMKQFDNEGEAFIFANKVVDVIMQNSKSLLEQNLLSIPKQAFTDPFPSWLYEFHNCKFVYFKEANVLGLIGDYGLVEVVEMFDTAFYFQNSSDQDYDYDLWDDKINIFKDIKKQVLALSDEDLANTFISGPENWYNESDREHIMKDIEYYRKTYLYNAITKALGVIDFIYDKNSERYDVFVFNGIKTQEQFFNLCKEFRQVVAPFRKEIEDEDNN